MKQDLEGKVVTKDKLKITVQPKTKKELEDIIKKTIEEKGDSCDLNFIDTSLITDMSELFLRSSFNGNISKWDTSNVENMRKMFTSSKFNGYISDWNTSNVVDMSRMFMTSDFEGDTSKWNTSNVKDMSEMFCGSRFDGDISKWDISKWKVSKDALVCGMFERTYLEEDNNLPDWYVHHSNKKDMFY